jgi:hypothetical protein
MVGELVVARTETGHASHQKQKMMITQMVMSRTVVVVNAQLI